MSKTKTATLHALKQKCLNRKARMRDEVVSVKSLFMDPAQPGRMIIRREEGGDEQSYNMNPRVYSQIPSVVYGLPGSYLKKLVEGEQGDPGLAALNFNHWVMHSKDKEVLLRFENQELTDEDGKVLGVSDEATLRACLPGTWNAIPYEASMETLIQKFGPDKEVQVTRFDDTAMVLDFITAKLDYKTNPNVHDIGKRDDPIEWGMRFRDSDAGVGPLEMNPYTRRLICLNGCTIVSRGAVIIISHSGKASRVLEEVLANVRQGVEMIGGYSAQIGEQITAAQGITLELTGERNQPESAFARVGKDENVTKLEDKYVREAWETEGEYVPEPSVFRLHNAFTRAGTHGEELTIDQKLHLQGVGGRLLELATTGFHWN